VDYELGIDLGNSNKEELSTTIQGIPNVPNLTYHIRCGDSLIEKVFGHPVQLKELARHDDGLIAKISTAKREYSDERDLDKKRRLELAVLSGYCELAERLIKRKKEGFKEIQRGKFGENKQERQQREEREEELEEFERVEKRAKTVKQRIAAALERKRQSERDYESIRAEFQGNIVWALDFAEIFSAHGGFSIVIANPPYISFGLRGNKAAKAEWGDYMRRYYPRSAEYKLSVYALFIDRGIQLVNSNGVLTYITPDSFLLGRYFSKLRRLILDSCAVRHVAMFEQDFWISGVVGRPTITTLTRPAAKSSIHASLFSTIDAFQRGVGRHYEYSSEYFETVAYNRFRLFFCRIAQEYVGAVEAGGSPLKSFARITTGVRSKSGQENVVATTRKGPTWKKGIVSGGQVHPYDVEWKGHYLNIDGDWLFSGGWDASIVEHPKIMIRQTGDSIIAAMDFDHLYHLNNVHSLAPLRNGISLPYLCALLNSRLMNRYYHLISLEYGRAMAQTDIETLELLPIREASPEKIERIEALVLRIDSREAQGEIEHIVEELYGLSPELIEYLRGDDPYPDPKESAARRTEQS